MKDKEIDKFECYMEASSHKYDIGQFAYDRIDRSKDFYGLSDHQEKLLYFYQHCNQRVNGIDYVSCREQVIAIYLVHQLLYSAHKQIAVMNPNFRRGIELLERVHDLIDMTSHFKTKLTISNKQNIRTEQGTEVMVVRSDPHLLKGRSLDTLILNNIEQPQKDYTLEYMVPVCKRIIV